MSEAVALEAVISTRMRTLAASTNTATSSTAKLARDERTRACLMASLAASSKVSTATAPTRPVRVHEWRKGALMSDWREGSEERTHCEGRGQGAACR